MIIIIITIIIITNISLVTKLYLIIKCNWQKKKQKQQ